MSASDDVDSLVNDLRQNGFSVIQLPETLIADALALAEHFFAFETQKQLSALASTDSGVLGFYPSEAIASGTGASDVALVTLPAARARGYSSFDFIDERLAGSSSVLKQNMWPDPHFAEQAGRTYRDIADAARAFSINLLEDLNKRRWLTRDSSRMLDEPCCSLMRVLSYDARHARIESKAHTDYELFSFVFSRGPGLEVRSPSGEWIQASGTSKSVVLLPGDMAEVLTNGRIQSCLHRVGMESGERLAAIFFQGLPLSTELNYQRNGLVCPNSFGAHILPLLARGAAHLQGQVDAIERELGCPVPRSNPFKDGKV